MVPSWAKNGDQNRGRAPISGDRVKFLVVGKGAERGHLEQIARICGVTDEVIFTDERHDVAAMLYTFDLFVAYSAQEAFGRSVLESLANGVPVLHTICPALRGLDVDRARQVLATVSEMPEALAAEVTAGHFTSD
jgi:glycosyltransferase involved in cell wall biosynthesis